MLRPKHVPKAAKHIAPEKLAARKAKRLRRRGGKLRVVAGTAAARALGIK